MIRSILCALCLTTASCTVVGPNYAPPQIALAQTFTGQSGAALSQAASVPWWEELSDPVLNRLVRAGAEQNLDVALALERIEEARFSAAAAGGRAVTGEATLSAPRTDTAGEISDSYAMGLSSSWVIDLYGGIERDVERSLANLDAARADLGDARLAYLAALVNAYLQARAAQENATLLRQTVENRGATLGLVQARLAVGEETELGAQRARADIARAEALLPSQAANFDAAVLRIATLLAQPVSQIRPLLEVGRAIPVPNRQGATAVPADLLRARPDILVAERRLAAATAEVGIAEAQLFPSIILSGSITRGTTDQWSFGPQLTLSVLGRGSLRASRDAALSRARQADLTWRQTVLNAVEEVEVALSENTVEWRRLAAQIRARAQS